MGNATKRSVRERYLDLFPMETGQISRQRWYKSKAEKDQWCALRTFDLDAMVDMHLDRWEEGWIGSAARTIDGERVTDFLLLDIDNDGSEYGLYEAWMRARDIVKTIGPEYPPLVFSSPGDGFHIIWFLDRTTRMSDLVYDLAPQSGGLVHRIVKAAIRKSGRGICEVFPAKGIVRWPLGHRQEWLDLETAEPRTVDDLEILVEICESHREYARRLTLEHLKSLDPGGTDFDTMESGSCTDWTISVARHAWLNGLTQPGTRNDVMYKLARVMLYRPEVLPGLDPDGDLAEQLLTWLIAKNNGYSKDYLRNPDPNHWRQECERYLESANRGFRPSGDPLATQLRLRDFDQVFSLPQMDVPRHRLELVYASLLSTVKSIVLHNELRPRADGSYWVQIHSSWWRQLQYCSGPGLNKYRHALYRAGAFWRGRKGSAEARRATEFRGFHVDFESPYPPIDMEVAMRLEREDRSLFMYCSEAIRRFPDLEARYGKAGARWIRNQHARCLAMGKRRAA